VDKKRAIRLLAKLDQHLSSMNLMLVNYLTTPDKLAALDYLDILESESSMNVRELVKTLKEDERQEFTNDEFLLFLDSIASFMGAGHMKKTIFETLISGDDEDVGDKDV